MLRISKSSAKLCHQQPTFNVIHTRNRYKTLMPDNLFSKLLFKYFLHYLYTHHIHKNIHPLNHYSHSNIWLFILHPMKMDLQLYATNAAIMCSDLGNYHWSNAVKCLI